MKNHTRKGKYSIEKIEDILKNNQEYFATKGEVLNIEEVSMKIRRKDSRIKVIVDGEFIKKYSLRYELFISKGCDCVECGIKGDFYALEKSSNENSYHLNLYAIKDGEEVLMTKDHIKPKSKGGLNTLVNFQTMCSSCNERKSDKYEIV